MDVRQLPVTPPAPLPPAAPEEPQTPPPQAPVPPQTNKRRGRLFCALIGAVCFTAFALTLFFVGREVFDTLLSLGFAEAVIQAESAVQAVQIPRDQDAPAWDAARAGGAFPPDPAGLYPAPQAGEDAAQSAERLEELYAFDYAAVPDGEYPILPVDLSVTDPTLIKNSTGFTPDMTAIAAAAQNRPAEQITDEPLVLIVHTHATECYAPRGAVGYDFTRTLTRTSDVTENVVAVGETLCEALCARGIPTLHDTTLHDRESYLHAYEYSAQTVEEILADHPSVRYVFDLHRDSMIADDYTKFRPVTLYQNSPCAQIMMLVGTTAKGAPDYPWQENLTLAVAISAKLCRDAPGVPRATELAGASYNQQLARYGLLLEIGSCGNSLDEAKTAARAFAAALAGVLKGE